MRSRLRSALGYLRTRLWEQTQWPDPDVIYRRDGMFGLLEFLRVTSSPTITKEVLSRYGADIHPDCWPIGPHVTIHEPGPDFRNLSLGRHVHIGKEVFLDLSDRLVIEQSAGVGMRAVLLTHMNVGHLFVDKPLKRLLPRRNKPTILRRGCSIGAGAIIACGVEIGEDAVVNAGVFVDRDVPPRTIVNVTRPRPIVRIPDRYFERHRERS